MRLVFALANNDDLFRLCSERAPMRSISCARNWRSEYYALEMLLKQFASVRISWREALLRALSVQQWLDGMKMNLAPVVHAYAQLDANQAAAFDTELLALGQRHNTAPDGTMFARAKYHEFYCRNKRKA